MKDVLARSVSTASALLRDLAAHPTLLDDVAEVGIAMADSMRRGGKVLACGNGGSLADAAHFAEELTGRFRNDRAPLPAIALTDPMHLTCVANDYGFEEVFSRMVVALGKPGDVLLLLSTSGNSENLIRAARAAKEQEVRVAGFLGRGGGHVAPLCDWALVFPGETSDRIQELHMLCLHAMIEGIEGLLVGSH